MAHAWLVHSGACADWAARGFSCELWTDSPGQRWENFSHATDEVVIVLEGDMEFEVAGQVHHRSRARSC